MIYEYLIYIRMYIMYKVVQTHYQFILHVYKAVISFSHTLTIHEPNAYVQCLA